MDFISAKRFKTLIYQISQQLSNFWENNDPFYFYLPLFSHTQIWGVRTAGSLIRCSILTYLGTYKRYVKIEHLGCKNSPGGGNVLFSHPCGMWSHLPSPWGRWFSLSTSCCQRDITLLFRWLGLLFQDKQCFHSQRSFFRWLYFELFNFNPLFLARFSWIML